MWCSAPGVLIDCGCLFVVFGKVTSLTVNAVKRLPAFYHERRATGLAASDDSVPMQFDHEVQVSGQGELRLIDYHWTLFPFQFRLSSSTKKSWLVRTNNLFP